MGSTVLRSVGPTSPTTYSLASRRSLAVSSSTSTGRTNCASRSSCDRSSGGLASSMPPHAGNLPQRPNSRRTRVVLKMCPILRLHGPMRRSASLKIRQYSSLGLPSLEPFARNLGHILSTTPPPTQLFRLAKFSVSLLFPRNREVRRPGARPGHANLLRVYCSKSTKTKRFNADSSGNRRRGNLARPNKMYGGRVVLSAELDPERTPPARAHERAGRRRLGRLGSDLPRGRGAGSGAVMSSNRPSNPRHTCLLRS